MRRANRMLAALGAAALVSQPVAAQTPDGGFGAVIQALRDLGDQVEAQTEPGSVDHPQVAPAQRAEQLRMRFLGYNRRMNPIDPPK